MKSLMLKQQEVTCGWWVIDATDIPVGRLATRIAMVLMGKHRPDYTPHVLCGEHVVVLNADKVKFTGDKWNKKYYWYYTGYPGGQRHVYAGDLKAKKPEMIIKLAVQRMLPKNKLAYRMIRRLNIYVGAEHPHQAQQPKTLSLQ